MDNIGIFNETDKNLENYYELMYKIVQYTLKKHNADNSELSIVFVDNNKIHEINKTYRGIDRPTDVISFALEDDKTSFGSVRVLGDIFISTDKVLEQHQEYGHSYERELYFLIVHGLLHLLGYDHMNQVDEEKMFKMQDEILEEFKIEK